ncbi:MAG: cell division protein FtsL [Defluviicoccus sp.]|nr:cell division protein FtsL [Defluviicoccus sp.]MDE0385384.1 cell division protein FtsL [Defluviicoccus sp.]
MRRGSTLLFAVLAVVMGAASIVIGTEVRDLEDRLAAIHRDIAREQEALHVLRAEWSYLNRPDRLEALARRHLGLRIPEAAQTMAVSDLPFAVRPDVAGEAPAPGPVAPTPLEISAKAAGAAP